MGKDIQLTGIAIALDPEETEIQVKTTSSILALDLAKLLEESNTSNIITIEFTSIIPDFENILFIPSFDLTENVIIPDASSFVPAINLTEQDTQEINSSEVLSFELRDYDQASLEFKIVLEFFNETGGVF